MLKRCSDESWQKKVNGYFKDEVIDNEGFVVKLLNSFVHFGPNGNHFCMVLELLGPSQLQIIEKINHYKITPEIYNRICTQILLGLNFLHDYCNIIHTDIKAENILLSLPQEDMEKIIEDEIERMKETNYTITVEIQKKFKLGEYSNQAGASGFQNQQNQTKKQKKQLKKKQKKKEKKRKKQAEQKDPKNSCDENGENANSISNKECGPAIDPNPEQINAQNDRVMRTKEQLLDGGKNPNKDNISHYKKNRHHKSKSLGAHVSNFNNEQNSENQWKKQDTNGQFSCSFEDITNFVNEQTGGFENNMKKKNNKGGFEIIKKLFLEGSFDVKIIDFSNACWTYHHFVKKITTRPQRAPEIILGIEYDSRVDIWSAACVFFKQLTGENLFHPRKGKNYRKDDDHLAQIIEVTGGIPLYYINASPKNKKYFDSNGKLRKINTQKHVDQEEMLIQKYQVKPNFSKNFVRMIRPMLNVMIKDRQSAKKLLKRDVSSLGLSRNIFMSDIEWQSYIWNQQEKYENNLNRGVGGKQPTANQNSSKKNKKAVITNGATQISKEKKEVDQELFEFDDLLSHSELFADVASLSSNDSYFSFGAGSFFYDLKNIENGRELSLGIDRSFAKDNFYVGYDDGIDPTNLDLIENLQFKVDSKK